MTLTLNTAEIKARLSELVHRVAATQERLIVMRRGKPVAALISLEDLHRLEALDVTGKTNGDTLHPVMHAFGGWADRDDLDDLIAEIYTARTFSAGREVDF